MRHDLMSDRYNERALVLNAASAIAAVCHKTECIQIIQVQICTKKNLSNSTPDQDSRVDRSATLVAWKGVSFSSQILSANGGSASQP